MELSERLKALEKKYGPGTVIPLTADPQPCPGFSTGSVALDQAICGSGFPKGKITEIFGQEASGKTTLCLEAIAACQREGYVAALIDAEHALDAAWAKKIGVTPDLLLAQPSYGEEALDICEQLVKAPEVPLVVVDSVAALVPRVELDGAYGDTHVGLQARLMSQAMRKLRGLVTQTDTCLIFTNQIREKVGVMYGSPEITPGGRALKFYADVRLDLRGSKSKSEVGKSSIKAKVVKNKLSPPLQVVEFDIVAEGGVDKRAYLLELAMAKGLVTLKGSYYYWGDELLAQGRADVLKVVAQRQSELGPKIMKN